MSDEKKEKKGDEHDEKPSSDEQGKSGYADPQPLDPTPGGGVGSGPPQPPPDPGGGG